MISVLLELQHEAAGVVAAREKDFSVMGATGDGIVARLSIDGKTLDLDLVDLRPVMQQRILYKLTARDGTPSEQEIQHTINVVP